MSIKIIDNFEVNVSKSIDNRFVVGPSSFYSDKDSIQYKYEGLRIWDLNDNSPYVWSGATWSNENTSGTVIGTGNEGYITKYTGISPTSNIGDSVIFELGGNIGIDTTTFGSPVAKLQVNGNIRSTGIFYGNGSQITSINASNITSGQLSITRLQNGSSGQLLQAGLSSPSWANASSITVGNATNATNATNANIILDNTNSNNIYVPFVNTFGNTQIKINTTNSIKINPSNGNTFIKGISEFQNSIHRISHNLVTATSISILTIYTLATPTDGQTDRYDILFMGRSQNGQTYTAKITREARTIGLMVTYSGIALTDTIQSGSGTWTISFGISGQIRCEFSLATPLNPTIFSVVVTKHTLIVPLGL
jgi:hypothetical protein